MAFNIFLETTDQVEMWTKLAKNPAEMWINISLKKELVSKN